MGFSMYLAAVYNNCCNNCCRNSNFNVLMDCLSNVEYSGEANQTNVKMLHKKFIS